MQEKIPSRRHLLSRTLNVYQKDEYPQRGGMLKGKKATVWCYAEFIQANHLHLQSNVLH